MGSIHQLLQAQLKALRKFEAYLNKANGHENTGHANATGGQLCKQMEAGVRTEAEGCAAQLQAQQDAIARDLRNAAEVSSNDLGSPYRLLRHL